MRAVGRGCVNCEAVFFCAEQCDCMLEMCCGCVVISSKVWFGTLQGMSVFVLEETPSGNVSVYCGRDPFRKCQCLLWK